MDVISFPPLVLALFLCSVLILPEGLPSAAATDPLVLTDAPLWDLVPTSSFTYCVTLNKTKQENHSPSTGLCEDLHKLVLGWTLYLRIIFLGQFSVTSWLAPSLSRGTGCRCELPLGCPCTVLEAKQVSSFGSSMENQPQCLKVLHNSDFVWVTFFFCQSPKGRTRSPHFVWCEKAIRSPCRASLASREAAETGPR